jgi:hypothetical protein
VALRKFSSTTVKNNSWKEWFLSWFKSPETSSSRTSLENNTAMPLAVPINQNIFSTSESNTDSGLNAMSNNLGQTEVVQKKSLSENSIEQPVQSKIKALNPEDFSKEWQTLLQGHLIENWVAPNKQIVAGYHIDDNDIKKAVELINNNKDLLNALIPDIVVYVKERKQFPFFQ